MNNSYLNLSAQKVPVLPLRNLVLFTGQTLPVRIGRSQSLAAVRAAERAQIPDFKGLIACVLQKTDENLAVLSPTQLHRQGGLCRVQEVLSSSEREMQVLLEVLERVQLDEFEEREGALFATAFLRPIEVDLSAETAGSLSDNLKSIIQQIGLMLSVSPSVAAQINNFNGDKKLGELARLIDWAASLLPLSSSQKQEILALDSLKARGLRLLDLAQALRDELELRTKVRDRVNAKLDKTQREAILREQMRALQEELGETTGQTSKQNYREKLATLVMPEDARKVALEEIEKLETLPSQSPELHSIRNYLDLLLSLPWSPEAVQPLFEGQAAQNLSESEREINKNNLQKAREILDADHYGMKEVKKRIIEQLAAAALNPGRRGMILLLLGPPGVGKTSLGQSVAKVMGRKFVRVSLGGVRDEADIRGHRRTYIGSMPGRIIQGIKRAGAKNPVFLLDEIDKLGRGFHGDPGSALLEVLDPEQNATFTDHYLDLAYDLSEVFFIATANSLESIPAPLLDRLEVIELSGYTQDEKLHIARRHLLPKKLAELGLASERLVISDQILNEIIAHHTREAGVRDLQRRIAALVRSSSTKIIESDGPVTLEPEELTELLGPPRSRAEDFTELSAPGMVKGLAWTPVGGETLVVESAQMPGSGQLILTGQLGEVMRESAQIALSLLRSRLATLSPQLDFAKTDFHIHVPAGAVPKDGPSAGVTLLSSLASLILARPVDARLAMTGEITLRGAVTPVGGIKEKIIAAHRAGVQRAILPQRNQVDLSTVPDEILLGLQISFVENIDQLLKLTLNLEPSFGGFVAA